MSYLPKKKFEVPVELHRVLGNQFAVDQHQKKEKRKQVRDAAWLYFSVLEFLSPRSTHRLSLKRVKKKRDGNQFQL